MDLRLGLAIYPLEILAETSEESSIDDELSDIGNPELMDFFDRDLNKKESVPLKNLENLTGVIANRNFDIKMLSIKYHNGEYYAVDDEKQYPLQDGDCLTLKDYVIQVSINNDSQMTDIQQSVFLPQDNNDYYDDIEIPRINDSRLTDSTKASLSSQQKYTHNELFFEQDEDALGGTIQASDLLQRSLNSHLELPKAVPERARNRVITSSERRANLGERTHRKAEPNILTELGIMENNARLSEYDDIRDYQSATHERPISFIEEMYDDSQQVERRRFSASAQLPSSYSRKDSTIPTSYRKNKFLTSLKTLKRIILD